MIERLIKPLIDEAYNKGFSAGVNAEKLIKAKRNSELDYDLLRRGAEIGREETLRALEEDIEEISTEEFNELTSMVEEEKPFGFVGTIDDIGLILDEAN
jgi:hypothetical protein